MRKGSVAEFIGNVRALAGAESGNPQWVAIVERTRELYPPWSASPTP